ncbi:MAG: hypothetical protein ACE5F1_13120 [Planctomycetota bacterium]
MRATSFLLLVGCAACSSTPYEITLPSADEAIPEILRGMPVYRTRFVAHGSAVPLGGSLLASASHVVPYDPIPQESSGAALQVEVVARGEGMPEAQEDWVVLRSPGLDIDPPYRVDFGHPVEEGDRVWLIGFPEASKLPEDSPPEIVPATVARFPPRSESHPREIPLFLPERARYKGASGGAVVALEDGKPVLIGIFQGHRELLDSENRRIGRLYIAVRLPRIRVSDSGH